MNRNITIAKQEALNRLRQIEERFPGQVNPNIRKYFNEGQLYYSYVTGNGFIGSIDTISYNPYYEAVIRDFESKGRLVYHVIESGNLLTLLYVSYPKDDWDDEEREAEWEVGRLADDNSLLAYVFNLELPELSEFGFVGIDVFMNSGSLIRTW
ncbi:TPA: hypothetical protein TZE22_001667 [Streptococcus suis]|nr:hypothetical protein [Streptococcus suis]